MVAPGVMAMRFVGTKSWQLRLDSPQQLAIGLYVRAAAGLGSAHSWLPAPTPAVRVGRQAPEAAARQWERWWDDAVMDELAGWWTPPFDGLVGSPELRSEVFRHFHDGVRWANQHRDPRVTQPTENALMPTHLVAELERAAGHKAAPFDLRVSVIPVEGKTMWQLAPDHVMVTQQLVADHEAYRRRLAVVVQALF
jgi:hypothetical protein